MANNKKPQIVGIINQNVIDLLGLTIKPIPIHLGTSNITHMKSEHPVDFNNHFSQLGNILSSPDYVAQHPKDGSIQYFKKYTSYVVVAVRVSSSGIFYARSIYEITEKRFNNYNKAGTIKKI